MDISVISQIFESNFSYGILFVILLVYTVKKSENRESELVRIIDKLSDEVIKKMEIFEEKLDEVDKKVDDLM